MTPLDLELIKERATSVAVGAHAWAPAADALALIAEVERLTQDRDEWKCAAEDGIVVVRRMEARLRPMEEALRFYADEENHDDRIVRKGRDSGYESAPVVMDRGERARAALSPDTKEE